MKLKPFVIDDMIAVPTPEPVPNPEARKQIFIERMGATLRTLRKSRGLSVAELQTTSGVAGSTISRIESGQSEPGAFTLVSLERALGVKAGWLIATAA